MKKMLEAMMRKLKELSLLIRLPKPKKGPPPPAGSAGAPAEGVPLAPKKGLMETVMGRVKAFKFTHD